MAAVGLAAWNVIPVYYANYSFIDKMIEMARRAEVQQHRRQDHDRQLEKKARELKIEDYINARTCKIQTMDTAARSTATTTAHGQVLPGWKHDFQFRNEADQPLL